MEEEIKKILELAIWAPSGENCQPWRFEIIQNKIQIFNLPERDQSLYSWGQRSSYVAHGALIENLVIAAKEFSYETNISLFPNSNEPNLVAEITVQKTSTKKDSLFNFIKKRHTNRKPYQTIALTQEQKKELLFSASEIEPGHFNIIEEKNQLNALCKSTSLNEQIVFENKFIHNFFFSHISWTKEEDRKKSIGFYIETLELPPPAKIIFKLVKNWGILNLLNRVGFSKLVSKDNFKTHSACSAHGLIHISENNPKDFIMSGRILQRVWLKATSMGLSMHPMTGIAYLNLKINSGETNNFSGQQVELIKDAYKNITNIFGIPNKIISMYFRIGQGAEPTARSSRLPAI